MLTWNGTEYTAGPPFSYKFDWDDETQWEIYTYDTQVVGENANSFTGSLFKIPGPSDNVYFEDYGTGTDPLFMANVSGSLGHVDLYVGLQVFGAGATLSVQSMDWLSQPADGYEDGQIAATLGYTNLIFPYSNPEPGAAPDYSIYLNEVNFSVATLTVPEPAQFQLIMMNGATFTTDQIPTALSIWAQDADTVLTLNLNLSAPYLIAENGGQIVSNNDFTVGNDPTEKGESWPGAILELVGGNQPQANLPQIGFAAGIYTNVVDIFSGGQVTVRDLVADVANGSVPNPGIYGFLIDGTNSLLDVTGNFNLGVDNSVGMNLYNGATLTVDGNLTLGENQGSSGDFENAANANPDFTSATNTTTTVGGDVVVGDSGTGIWATDGTTNVTGAVSLGNSTGGMGTVTIDPNNATGAQFTSGGLTVGGGGTGVLLLNAGDTLFTSSTPPAAAAVRKAASAPDGADGDVTIGDEEGSNGKATINGEWGMGTLTVGSAGMGLLKLQNGAQVMTTTETKIGDEATGNGTVYVANDIVNDDGSLSTGSGNLTSWSTNMLTVGAPAMAD